VSISAHKDRAARLPPRGWRAECSCTCVSSPGLSGRFGMLEGDCVAVLHAGHLGRAPTLTHRGSHLMQSRLRSAACSEDDQGSAVRWAGGLIG